MRAISVCFDLDGTLVDTAPDLIRVLNLVIAKEGLPETDYAAARQFIGFGSRALINHAFERVDHSASEERIDTLQKLFLKLYAEDVAQVSQPFPGVFPMLRELRREGYNLSVCTNKPGYLARPLIKALGMDPFFTRIIGGDDLERNKPYADHIYACAGHRDSRRIIMIGDGKPDALAAKAAQVPCLLMSYGYSDVPIYQLGADRVLRSARDIPAAIRALGL